VHLSAVARRNSACLARHSVASKSAGAPLTGQKLFSSGPLCVGS